jgi:small subunit ribosomal protein S1
MDKAMSDAEKPAETGEPQSSPAKPAEAEPQGPAATYRRAWQERSQAPLKGKPQKRLEPKPAPPPQLPVERGYGEGPKLRDLDAAIEQELNDALGGFNDKDVYGEPERDRRQMPTTPEQGRKKGRVVAIHGADVFIDVPGGRSQGVLPLLQFPQGPPELGTEVEITIEGYDVANGLLLLSRQGAAVQADWSSVAAGMIVEARVTETNKGGLAVEINGIRGFMPISQIDLYRVEDAEQFINQRLRCMVVEVNPEERNLVVSRRALLEKEREENREKLWQELAEGQVREGVVRSIRDFGAFVDLGGVDGLVHISEMSWGRVKNAADVVQPGQTVKVVVLKLDREHRKVGLGLRQLTDSPWDSIDANYPLGSTVKGTVTRLMDFGAFVELEPGIEGLVHISEIAHQRIRRPADLLQPGQEVQVRVLNTDREQRRMSLSIKAALPAADEEKAEENEQQVEAEVQETKPTRQRTIPLRGGLGD